MLRAMFNEAEAQEVLATVNEKVAGIFLTEPKRVRFIFVSFIASRQPGKVVLGLCLHEAGEIQIRVAPGWQSTAIHELVHLYNPGCSEKRTRQISNDVIRYLKGKTLC